MLIDDIRDPLILSLLVASVATLVVGVVGGVLGRWLAVRQGGLSDIVDALASLPLFLPPTVLGYYLTLLVGRQTPVGEFLSSFGVEFTFTWLGAALASGVVALPLMVRSARIAFEGISHEVEDSAALDGAGRFSRWRYILLPLARGGLAGGVVLAFARGIGEFGATLMLSGSIPGRTRTMPLAIYEAFTLGDDETAALLSVILTAVSLVVVVLGLRLGRKR
ncbi:MAG: molybdate ABC transporter permease subunit [Ignavibacteriae bacterium]|nr:molybdate ABC transporter permease subunit [Ignavibacteriota bacterium]MCB9215388.1 molybdate ABC transporter permease subunit [Ignavibacteria bacterium]